MESLGDWVRTAPWKSRLLLLIDLDTMQQAHRVGEKRDMLATDHRLIAVWPGDWSSSARGITQDDRTALLRDAF